MLTKYGQAVYDIATENKRKSGDNGNYGEIDLEEIKAKGILTKPDKSDKKRISNSKPLIIEANLLKPKSSKNIEKNSNSDSSSGSKYCVYII